ncbi:Protein DCL, chloroplastic [Dichanthelium oligosanthes]|uniref:Protein DCL, chloroplastic n=1 Tax=Dichanthelium oligosanthes TaxID=888268 RepID=A0A1E5VNZ3_9POAL|nr:Protein DCL, chloroplastic [Dichanthelium oligosanthes]
MQFPSPRAHAMAVAVAAPAVARPRLVPVAHLACTSCLLLLRGRGRGHGRAVAAVRAREQGAAPPDPAAILRRPDLATTTSAEEERETDAGPLDGPVEEEAPEEEGIQGSRKGPEREWVDWEDLILEDTVPLVGFVRMILHSGKYATSPLRCFRTIHNMRRKLDVVLTTSRIILQVGLHPEFENSRCLFIVRKDGERVDFSFWKCIKGLIRQKYPMYADSFILRHFRRRQDY